MTRRGPRARLHLVPGPGHAPTLNGDAEIAAVRDFLLAPFVNEVYGHPGIAPAPVQLLATYSFAFQIYFDFSGYSDMAIGIGWLLGFQLPKNFDSPYRATSIVDFWRRWHITLSEWLRDYLYISLGGNRKGLARTVANVFVTMALGGLWHGASWTFLVWGLYHGVRPVQQFGQLLMAGVAIQVTLGVAALAVTQGRAVVGAPSTLEVTIATAHQATGAFLLALSVALLLWTRRLFKPE